MKTRMLTAAALALVSGLGQGASSVKGASGGSPSPWIGSLPDLYVASHSFLDYGGYIALGITVKNGGRGTAAPFYVTAVSPLGSYDIQFGSLGPGQSQLHWLWISKAATPSGTPYFFAVDSYNHVGEYNEGNNLYTVLIP